MHKDRSLQSSWLKQFHGYCLVNCPKTGLKLTSDTNYGTTYETGDRPGNIVKLSAVSVQDRVGRQHLILKSRQDTDILLCQSYIRSCMWMNKKNNEKAQLFKSADSERTEVTGVVLAHPPYLPDLAKNVMLLHNNARPHTSQQIQNEQRSLEFTVLTHPPYSPGLAKNVLLLHDNARPHTNQQIKNELESLGFTVQQTKNELRSLGFTVLAHPPYSPDLKKKVLLLHNNARPHSSQQTKNELRSLGFTVLAHPPYSPDLKKKWRWGGYELRLNQSRWVYASTVWDSSIGREARADRRDVGHACSEKQQEQYDPEQQHTVKTGGLERRALQTVTISERINHLFQIHEKCYDGGGGGGGGDDDDDDDDDDL
ncbi:hypothetical protein ANN_23744 [Periplaneta americana]|uniref:Uncharacterized protein n=1 Tax=Periplaneta americana TaxID=6978 RepID=A0ABQ8SMF4_PERAM|nr:hypothetical protein ANN_23744 [Periplaneta americana]